MKKCTNSAKSRMDANMELTTKSFRPLFPDKIFSPTLPWLPDISLTAVKIPDISMFSVQVVTLSVWHMVSPATQHYLPLVSTKLYYLLTESYVDNLSRLQQPHVLLSVFPLGISSKWLLIVRKRMIKLCSAAVGHRWNREYMKCSFQQPVL